MKKVLRFLLILIVILFVGYLILCATSPAQMNVERSTTINAPKPIVWHQVTHLDNFKHYSPWQENDPTIESTITGPSGEPGHKSSWVSENSGSGEMTITSIDGDTMKYDMHFIAPFEGTAKGATIVESTDEGTKVTCTYKSDASFMMRGANTLFFSGFMGSMFERQLELLKEHVESGEAEMPAPVISEATFPATEFVAIRKEIGMDEMESFFGEAYQKLGSMAGDKITGTAYSITYKWDEENGKADVAAAFPVSGPVKGAEMISIPEKQGYMLTYTGPYSGLQNAHMALYQHADKNGLNDPLAIEEYVVMPPQETDTNKFVTKIYHLER